MVSQKTLNSMLRILFLLTLVALLGCSDTRGEACISDGEGIAEKELAVRKEFSNRISEAAENKDGKAFLEAYAWYYNEMKALRENSRDFISEANEVYQKCDSIDRAVAASSWISAKELSAISKIKKKLGRLE